jgi:hypothetical protein
MSGKYMQSYVRIRKNGKQIGEHRVIMEDFFGRRLEHNEIIHHKNGNIRDNRIENLELLTNEEHCAMHQRDDKCYITVTCYNCGRKIRIREKLYNWKMHHGQKNIFCSRSCTMIHENILRKGRLV